MEEYHKAKGNTPAKKKPQNLPKLSIFDRYSKTERKMLEYASGMKTKDQISKEAY